MFLSRINHEQKELFLDLCIHAANANNVVADAEKDLIEQYCWEMRIENSRIIPKLPFKEAAQQLSQISTAEEMRMITIELMALMISDNDFDDSEKQFMSEFADLAHVSQEDLDVSLSLLRDLGKLYDKINDFVSAN